MFFLCDEYSDSCVLDSFGRADSIDETIIVKSFLPFDPTNKRTEVTYQMKSNLSIHRVTKGMPDAILRLCIPDNSRASDERERMRLNVNEFAKRGLRSLAVAIAEGDKNFRLIGLLPIFDPPREDTKETVMKALELGIYTLFFNIIYIFCYLTGVKVKMITGDQLEIAKETGRRLGMGDTMYVYAELIQLEDGEESSTADEDRINETVLSADGFASVFPEHKFEIVDRLQHMGHLVAMTGNFVNFDFSSSLFYVR